MQTQNLISINLIVFFAAVLLVGVSFAVAAWKKTTVFSIWLGIIKGFLKFLSDVFNGIEKSLLDLICVIVPYATPLVPAYLTFDNAQTILGLPAWVAWTVAFVFESLGLASVATAVRFWRHNKKNENRAHANQAPFSAARNIYISYLVVVILVNVVLESMAGTRDFWGILTIAALSILSFPAASLVALRQIYSDILEEKEQAKAANNGGSKPTNGNQPQAPAAGQKQVKHASDYLPKITALLDAEHKATGKVLTPRQVTDRLKQEYKITLDHDKSKGYISTKTSDWKRENKIMGFD